MQKHFISANDLLLDSFRLAEQIYRSEFRPDFIIGIWRGGSPVGIAVQEYLDFKGIVTDHIAIRTASYYGIDQQDKHVKVFGLNYVLDHVRSDLSLLIVDDVFDSGRSIVAVIEEIRSKALANCPGEIRVACPWYKPARNKSVIEPDYFLRTTDQWLIFPHELSSLTRQEITESKGKEISEMIFGTDENEK